MTIAHTVEGGRSTIKIVGRFDFSCHADFRRVTKLASEECRDLVVDLAETTYVDSAALGMLLLLREQASKQSARVSIVHCHGQAKDVLQLSNFSRLFTIEYA